jgi:CHAD domain-containing protein
MSYRLRARETVEHGLRRIASKEITKAITEVDDRCVGPHATVHQARKRCKKLRALLRLVRPALAGGGTFELENAWYRDTGREIATVRDAQTRVETLEALLSRYGPLVADEVFGRVRSGLVARREDLLADATVFERCLEEVRERLEVGRRRVDGWELECEGFDALAGGLERSYGQARAALERAYGDPCALNFHTWRKRVKDHRYHVRLLRDVWQRPMHARELELHALSDLLGEDHDLVVLEDFLSEHPDAVGGAAIVRVLQALVLGRRAELRAAARPLGARLFAEKSKRLVARFGAWHRVW